MNQDILEQHALLLKFIGSLTLADHIGDVSEDIDRVLRKIGLDIEWDDLSDLASKLGRLGITTLSGTSLADEGSTND